MQSSSPIINQLISCWISLLSPSEQCRSIEGKDHIPRTGDLPVLSLTPKGSGLGCKTSCQPPSDGDMPETFKCPMCVTLPNLVIVGENV